MLKTIIALKDTVAETFLDPRTEINTASAMRTFRQSVQDHPNKDDFALYQIGMFDTDKGEILACEPIRIMSGHEVKKLPDNLQSQSGDQ